jgi:peptidoglycan/xylan/chitin deacetylase (PgdA/CDA1 family)
MRAYVLTYHSGNIGGNDYASNNLVALAEDLIQLRALAIPVVPLRDVVAALLAREDARLPERVAALTLDDGLDFDFDDLEHPLHGPQTSVRTVLERHQRELGERVHATSFVIASPDARRRIAEREMLGHQWIGEHWWAPAVASGRFDIGNHGWDHVSPSAAPPGAGSFRSVVDYDAADRQVRVAREYIAAKAPNPGVGLFAYPYGDPSDYAADVYFPRYGDAHGTIAAFTGRPGPIHAAGDRWRLPRYTCGMDWRSTEDLVRLVRD